MPVKIMLVVAYNLWYFDAMKSLQLKRFKILILILLAEWFKAVLFISVT